jgi:hypothetical protein
MSVEPSHNAVDLGKVNNLAVIQKPGVSETLLMVGQSQGGRWARIMTRGAAQTLWFHLTQILYPRAASQLTQRAQTAVLRKSDAPTITSFVEVFHMEDRHMIRLRGIGGVEEWLIYFDYEEAHELWAGLERILKVVG